MRAPSARPYHRYDFMLGATGFRRTSVALTVLAALATLWFGMRSYHTFILLRSAYEVGMPQASTVRGWMTLGYIASAYHIPATRLIARLDLPATTSPDESLMAIAEKRGISHFGYVRDVQRSIADIAPLSSSTQVRNSAGWLDWFNDRILAALLRYGYAVLALTLLLGAIGLPVPTGLAATMAGSLSASGRLDWLAAGLIATGASVLGDTAAYGIGRGVSEQFLARRGRWFGFNARRQVQARTLFARWGTLTVLITRTLVSHLSSVVSLLAGISHYRLAEFLPMALLGRALWTAAYMALGFAIGDSLDAAADFLKNLSGLLVAVPVLVGSTLVATGKLKLGRHPKA